MDIIIAAIILFIICKVLPKVGEWFDSDFPAIQNARLEKRAAKLGINYKSDKFMKPIDFIGKGGKADGRNDKLSKG